MDFTDKKMHQLVEVAKVISHKARIEILHAMGEQTRVSPVQLARQQIGHADVSNVSYHMRKLQKARCLSADGTDQRRGSTEHYYKLTQLGQSILALIANIK